MRNTIEIKSIEDLLEIEELAVPSYQRPYKWGEKNIIALLQDIEYAITTKKKIQIAIISIELGQFCCIITMKQIQRM